MTATMRAVVLRAAGGPEQLACEQLPVPSPGSGEALSRVHAAAITRDELEWPVDRLPAIPSYEVSGVVDAVGPGVDGLGVGVGIGLAVCRRIIEAHGGRISVEAADGGGSAFRFTLPR